MTIADVGEHALIARIRARAGDAPAWVELGIGDDAAVVAPARGELDVVTTDCQIEDVHFSRRWMSMRDIGAKALAVNLSDLAAMAATPRAATLSLALPPTLLADDFDALTDGFMTLAQAAKVTLVGGNISRSPGPIVINVTLIGTARRRRILTRSGGAPGHLLYATGTLGRAAAFVREMNVRTNVEGSYASQNVRTEPQSSYEPQAAVRTPNEAASEACIALLRLARAVAANRLASACMDLSDGLADGVAQLAAASGTGCVISSSKVPVDPTATLEDALRGGEDYELLFAVPPRRRRAFEKIAGRWARVTCIGELTKDPARQLDATPLGGGFVHF